jgi:hypothetical protein
MIEKLLLLSLSSYALTFVITSSSILESTRQTIIHKTVQLEIGNHKHFIECRMCVGFWVSLVVCNADFLSILPVYGLSYFLATQER